MKRLSLLVALTFLAAPAFAVEVAKPAEAQPAEQPHVDVVFCIDRSGSMREVIETAKRKVWSIVNQVAKAKPAPVLRIGLIGYGNGENLVHTLDLTSDLDEVYKQLTTYKDNAGGGAEFVGHAIHVATEKMKWAEGKQTLKIIYVVGNETAHQGPPNLDYTKTAPAAVAKGIIVNAIYCGQYDKQTAPPTWMEMAKLADGKYMEIAGDGGGVMIATPFDKELGELNGKLNATYIAYGARGGAGAANQVAQDANATNLSTVVLAERVASKAAHCYACPTWDLIDACKQKDFDLSKLKDEELPEEMRKLDKSGRAKYVEAKSKEREAVQKEIFACSAKRDAYVKEALAKAPARADSFDAAVLDSLQLQAESKGFAFEK